MDVLLEYDGTYMVEVKNLVGIVRCKVEFFVEGGFYINIKYF